MYFQNNVFLGNKHFRGAAATAAAAAEEFPVPARPHPITQGLSDNISRSGPAPHSDSMSLFTVGVRGGTRTGYVIPA